MKRTSMVLLLVLALGTGAAVFAIAQDKKDTAAPKSDKAATPAKERPQHATFLADQIPWAPAGDALRPGAMAAVLEGDPSKPQLFTMRIKFPDGFRIAPHWHSNWEHVTVISGTFNLGMGETFDETKGTALPAGSFTFMAPKMRHYAWATGETVVQLHGTGPWDIIYVNAADDPRKKTP